MDDDKESAAFETAGVLRMHRHGMTYAMICRLLKKSGVQIGHELHIATDEELAAHAEGVPVHDARIIVCCNWPMWKGDYSFWLCQICGNRYEPTLEGEEPSTP